MTPLPKRKLSRLRQGTRRASFKLVLPQIQKCPKCGKPKLPHKTCENCL
ncbi:MAG: 50S ribosomal protein L32 [Patescibacteria group bacterium]